MEMEEKNKCTCEVHEVKEVKEVYLPQEEGDLDEAPESNAICTSKKLIWIFPRLIVIVFLIILLGWIYEAEGGIGNQDSSMFGWHALLMALFIVVFTQEGILVYSAPLLGSFTKNRKIMKFFHVTCHILGIICAIGGLIAIVYYKSLSGPLIVFPFYTMYSPHSWLGVALLSLWIIQMIAGIFWQNDLFQSKLSPNQKRTFSKYHKFLGKFIYGVGLATCAMGLQDMQSSDLAGSTQPMPNMTDAQMMMMGGNMTGYLPDSNLAQYASGGVLLLLLSGLATLATFVR